MKPIEEGCLAILINSGELTGSSCTVIKYTNAIPDRPELGGGWWEVEPHFDLSEDKIPYSREQYLMRIDGGEFEFEEDYKILEKSE